jgi:hypothetical protein
VTEIIEGPDPDGSYESLAALYSGFAYAEHWRKVVLASCTEAIRAGASLQKQRISEARLKDMARVHPAYLSYLERHLRGRMAWEAEVKKEGGIGR